MRVSSTAYRCKLGFGCNENTGIVRWIAYGSAPTAALLPSETASYPAFNECAILARRLRRGLVVKQVAHLTAATSRFKVHRRGKLPFCDISENRGPTKTNLLDHFREPQQPLRVRCAFEVLLCIAGIASQAAFNSSGFLFSRQPTPNIRHGPFPLLHDFPNRSRSRIQSHPIQHIERHAFLLLMEDSSSTSK
jgi:hypothetical protein